MSSIISTKLILIGAYEGKTVVLAGHKFTDGECTLTGDIEEVKNLCRYLQKCYQAYPEGSKELEGKEGKNHGEHNTKTDKDRNEVEDVQSQLSRPSGQEPEAAATEDRKPDAESRERKTRVLSDRDGHSDTRIPDGEDKTIKNRICKALAQLDPENDDHWTALGKPAMLAVEGFYGSADITRRNIERVAPSLTRSLAETYNWDR